MFSTALAAERVDTFDQQGRRTGYVTLDQGAGRLDLFDTNSNRTGYGIQRPDGSWDLFNRDGSRLGVIYPGQPARIILQPHRR